MTTPIIQVPTAATVTQALGTFNNNAYSAGMRIQRSALSFAALLADFRIPSLTLNTAATGGSFSLVAIYRDFSGTAGASPSSTNLGRFCGSFTPIMTGATTTGILGLNSVSLSTDADYYVLDNGTGANVTAGVTMTAQPWSPGT